MQLLQTRVQVLKEDLGNTAGTDPLVDRWKTGAIAAYNDLLKIEFEEVEQ